MIIDIKHNFGHNFINLICPHLIALQNSKKILKSEQNIPKIQRKLFKATNTFYGIIIVQTLLPM